MQVHSPGFPREMYVAIRDPHQAVLSYAEEHLDVDYYESVIVPPSVSVYVDGTEWRVWRRFGDAHLEAMPAEKFGDHWAPASACPVARSGTGDDDCQSCSQSEGGSCGLQREPTMSERIGSIAEYK